MKDLLRTPTLLVVRHVEREGGTAPFEALLEHLVERHGFNPASVDAALGELVRRDLAVVLDGEIVCLTLRGRQL